MKLRDHISLFVSYWGASVRYNYNLNGEKFYVKNAKISSETLVHIEQYDLNEFVLFLKDVSQISDEDLKHIGKLAIQAEDQKIKFEIIRDDKESVSIMASTYWIELRFHPFVIYLYDKRNAENQLHPYNLPIIIDYLRMKSYDLNGFIEKGLAIEIE